MKKRTALVFEEKYLWHDTGSLSGSKWVEPSEFWENPLTKRRFYNLLDVANILDKLTRIRARPATVEEVTRFHTKEYYDKVQVMSAGVGGDAGDWAPFSHGSFEIALLSAGGVLVAVESVLSGEVSNAYCLVRPPGHHAESAKGMGFCIFNNLVLGAYHAKAKGLKKIAIVDYDVHHGNGTQKAFWDDPNVLFISLHQDSNYPAGSGTIDEIGGESAKGTTINIPLHPGSGSGAYRYAFEQIVLPALNRFEPELILVSSGFDAAYADMLGSMMLSSEDFRYFAEKLLESADQWSQGRIIFAHEGGYSKDYVPFCGLAVIETISGEKTEVEDHYLPDINLWGYQALQPHQKALIDRIAILHKLGTKYPLEWIKEEKLEENELQATLHIKAVLEQFPKEIQNKLLNKLK